MARRTSAAVGVVCPRCGMLAARIIEMMRATKFPNGLNAVGYLASDVTALAQGAFPQKRVLSNSPRPVNMDELRDLFSGAMAYW